MKIHIVDRKSSDDTLCGEETCRHCPWGFIWLDVYLVDGFSPMDDMTQERRELSEACLKCRDIVAKQ